MINYLIRRLASILLLVFLAATFLFFIVHAIPGSPYAAWIQAILEKKPRAVIPASHLERLNALSGLDQPLHVRYLYWMRNTLTGNLGESWAVAVGMPVLEVILSRLPYTLLLMVTAFVLSIFIAMPLGIYSAVHQYSNGDLLITFASYLGIAMPAFWLGLLLIAIFSNVLHWLPYGGVVNRDLIRQGDIIALLGRVFSLGLAHRELAGQEKEILIDGLKHLIMPAAVLATLLTARWIRFLRSAMLEVLRQDYIRTARAKGVSRWGTIVKHGLRNALVPLVTAVSLDVPTLFTGAFITENVFFWPGIGRLYVDSIIKFDWPLLLGLLIFNAFLILAANLIADLLDPLIDPRIQYNR